MPKQKPGRMEVRIIKAHDNVRELLKAEVPTQVQEEDAYNAGDWIYPEYNQQGLAKLVENSSILPQCIRAYKNNIAGFGIGVRYIDDQKETPEMMEEFDRASKIIDLLNTEQDTKEVFEDLIEARETYGIAYLEVIRNFQGEVEIGRAHV